MSLLDILVYPDPRLRRKALPVECVDDEIRQLVRDMAETMYNAPGIGLAATQVNVSKQVIVIDHSEERNELQVFINPVIRNRRGETETEEGCLSVPGIVAPVKRAEEVTVTALDSEGQINEYTASGILAVCIQHELDHLNGKVFVDYLLRNWNPFLAFLRPYFFRSFTLGSLFKKPSFFKGPLNSAFISMMALLIPNIHASDCPDLPPPCTLINRSNLLSIPIFLMGVMIRSTNLSCPK